MIRSGRRLALTVLFGLALGAVGGAGPAEALVLTGTLSCSGPHGECQDVNLEARALPGERNTVVATDISGEGRWRWRIQDATAPIVVEPSSTCAAVDEHTATCPFVASTYALGDGDDTFRVAGPWMGMVKIDGGEGDDVLDVTRADPASPQYLAILDGGPGDDTIVGSGTTDIVWLSTGRDRIEAPVGAAGRRLSGSAGVVWDVDLSAGTALHGDDRTDFSGVSGVSVARGTLIGDDGDNALSADGLVDGRAGDDVLAGAGVLIGGAGDDQLTATGPGRADAGSGDDEIVLHGAGRVNATCGSGIDVVTFDPFVATVRSEATLDPRCEVVRPGNRAGDLGGRPTEGRRRVSIRVSCASSMPCGGRLAVAGLPRSVRYALAAGDSRLVRIPKLGHRPRWEHGRIRMSLRPVGPVTSQLWWVAPRTAR